MTTILSSALPPELASEKPLYIPEWLKHCLENHPNALNHMSSEDVTLVSKAFQFAQELHKDQYRKSGEPYIIHPIAVAGLLRDLGGDGAMIAAGFLHDVVEDTEVSIEEIEQKFGPTVRQLVEGVTKISKFNFSSNKRESQAENFRRMFLAMTKDIRVIVVKLADRLHNMRTLEHLKPEKQHQIALETKEIFAPLANRLGIWRFKWELEDLAFKYLEPQAYRDIQELVAEKRGDREARLSKVVQIIRERLEEEEIPIREITARPKHLYSIYQKMRGQNKEFQEIYDLAGIRLILENKHDCYLALAIAHDAFKPIPNRFKDYIGLPKPNRYQSLHTSVVGLNGRPLEIQMRTYEMHMIAEYGIAAHWKYKENKNPVTSTKLNTDEQRFAWLRQVLEWQNDIKDAQDFLQGMKQDLFFDEDIYVFTPKGEVMALPKGATPIDFAYRIHSAVGNRTKGVKVNDTWSVLDVPLKNGDMVEIITSESAHPNLGWLNFVVTTNARHRIRQWYKLSQREENIARGKEVLEKELIKTGLENIFKSNLAQELVEKFNFHKLDDFLAAIGYGEVTTTVVINRWREIVVKNHQKTEDTFTIKESKTTTPHKSKFPIAGVEGLLHHLARCCHPLPCDPIVGVITRDLGVVIHRQSCNNLEQFAPERFMPVSWIPISEEGKSPIYPVQIRVKVFDRVGIFRDVLNRISDNNINVRDTRPLEYIKEGVLINLTIDIQDGQQLQRLVERIGQMSDVIDVNIVGR